MNSINSESLPESAPQPPQPPPAPRKLAGRLAILLVLLLLVLPALVYLAAGLPLLNAREVWLQNRTEDALHQLRFERFGIRPADYERARAAIALTGGRKDVADAALSALSKRRAPWFPVFTKSLVARKLVTAGKFEEFRRFDRAAADRRETSEVWLDRAASEIAMGDISSASQDFQRIKPSEVDRGRLHALRAAIEERRDGSFPLLLDRYGRTLAEWKASSRDLEASRDFAPLLDRAGGSRTVEAQLTGSPGASIIETTLDPFVQRAALAALGTHRGSFVAIDTATNEILAVANSGGAGPISNLAFDGDYEPGSVVKVLTSLDAVQSGVDLSHFFPRPCEGSLTLDGKVFRDWQKHGVIEGLDHALAVSCNVTLGELGLRLGKERLISFMESAGFNSTIDTGLVRTPLGRTIGTVSSQYDLASLAIGLEKERMNALHVAMVASMVANRGVFTVPHLVRLRRTVLGDTLPVAASVPGRRIAGDDAVAAVTEAMRAVVDRTDGTGRRSAVPGFPIAMKTGTAGEGANGFNSVILAFAPADNPRIAIGMISEHTGPAEYVGAQIAHDFFAAVSARRQ